MKKETIKEKQKKHHDDLVEHENNTTDTKEIKVIEKIIENREIAPQDAFGKLNRSQIQLIKSTIG